MVTFRKAELTSTAEPENHDLYYDVLELIEGLEAGTIKATGNVQHLAPMVFEVIAQVLNGGFEQARTNMEQKVVGVAESFFGDRENLNRFAELCDSSLELDLPDEDSGNVDSSLAAFETLDNEFYEKKQVVLEELMSMIRESLTTRKAEIVRSAEPENHDLYYDVLELIEGLEDGSLKASGNVQHLAPMVFNVIAEVLNGGFEQAMNNCDRKVMGVAESFFGERENLNRFAELCDEATQLELPDEDSGNVESAQAAFEALDNEFYEKKQSVLEELMSMIRESLTTKEATVAGSDPTGNGAPSSEVPAAPSTGVEAPVTADGGSEFTDSSEATAFMEKIEEMLNDPRLEAWIKATDNNLSSKFDFGAALEQVQFSYHDLLEEMYKAGE